MDWLREGVNSWNARLRENHFDPLVWTRSAKTREDVSRWIGGHGGPAFLMAFETDEATVYQVRTRHRNEEVREVVPSDYGGVMVYGRSAPS